MKNIIIIIFLTISFLNAQERHSIHQIESERFKQLKIEKIAGNSSEVIPLDKTVEKNLSHAVFGYYPYWELSNNSHQRFNYDCLTHIAIFDFEVTATGQLDPPSGWPSTWTDFMNEAHTNGVKLVFSITNFSRTDAEMNNLFTNSFNRWAFMLGVQRIIRDYNLDGVNIDFEGLAVEHRGSVINDFMQEISDSVHSISEELEVSFAAPAVNWGGWDLTGLANSCDYLFVMGYDFYGSWSSKTGPTAPLISNSSYNVTNTINQEYATVSTFYPEKIILGVPYYSPHWKAASSSEGASVTGWVGSERYYAAQQASEIYGLNWSSTFKNAWYNYVESGEHHQVWFDDDSSLGLKYDLAINKNLKGIGMWALGYDGTRDELWNLIEEKFSIPVSVENEEVKPVKFYLEQNYPNPFNPNTTIKYSVVENNQNVHLRVSDVLGRTIKSLVNKDQEAGNYEVKFDASKLPSGVYYYTLQQGTYFETRKMLLIK